MPPSFFFLFICYSAFMMGHGLVDENGYQIRRAEKFFEIYG
jgi:hypothetical protein